MASRSPKKKRRGFLLRYWWLWTVPLLGLLAVAGALVYVYVKIPLTVPPTGALTTYLYDANGKVVTTFHGEIDRTLIKFEQMPEHFRQAVIASEDRGFYDHPGISPFAIVRAAWADLTNREIVQGGSTITQQYVKNVFDLREKSLFRKIKEAILALKLENELSKDQILEKYLNTIYFGHGAYGVQAAAEAYFNKAARELNVLESATIAAVIPAPGTYDPIGKPAETRRRRDLVLNAMAEEGYITPAKAEYLKQKPVRTAKDPVDVTPAAYFVDYTKVHLQEKYGVDNTFNGGLKVTTTLNREWQTAAEEAVTTHLGEPGDPSVALVAIDPRSGAVRAMVGGRDFDQAKVNLATGRGGTGRQAGSAFKTFTLASAMEQRIDPFSNWNGPGQITIEDPACKTGDELWEPGNYGDSSQGTMDLVSATAGSVNTIYAQLVQQVRPANVAEIAHRMGIESPLEAVCSITLGSQSVTPLEMTTAYATLAARGVKHVPTPIKLVKAPDGDGGLKTLEANACKLDDPEEDDCERALSENDADLVTYALQRVVTGGTASGTLADFPRPAAGKTGTSQNNADAWFCGYVPQLATCVWVGYPQGQIPMTNVHGISVTGGSFPAQIWEDFMLVALADEPVEEFVEPSFEGYDVQPFDAPAVSSEDSGGGGGGGEGGDSEVDKPDPAPEPEKERKRRRRDKDD